VYAVDLLRNKLCVYVNARCILADYRLRLAMQVHVTLVAVVIYILLPLNDVVVNVTFRWLGL
jgi:hypothetical protein